MENVFVHKRAASGINKDTFSKRVKRNYLKKLFRLKDYGIKLMLCEIIQKTAELGMTYLSNRLLTKNQKGYVVKEILGSKMYLDLADIGISHELMVDGIREAASVKGVGKGVKEGDIVVDIGANIGYYALYESRLTGSKGKVYAIEPVLANMELLRKNVELNGYSNIEMYQIAIGDTNKTSSMYLSSKRNLHSLRDIKGTLKEKYFTEKIEVKVTTLDEFIKDKAYPDYIRMDVEGYEYQIIKGMKDILAKKLPLKMFIEFHFHLLSRQETLETFETLRQAGFDISIVASEASTGWHRYKLLSKVMRSVEPTICSKLHRRPVDQYLNLSMDDILSDPVILNGQWGVLQIFFERD